MEKSTLVHVGSLLVSIESRAESMNSLVSNVDLAGTCKPGEQQVWTPKSDGERNRKN